MGFRSVLAGAFSFLGLFPKKVVTLGRKASAGAGIPDTDASNGSSADTWESRRLFSIGGLVRVKPASLSPQKTDSSNIFLTYDLISVKEITLHLAFFLLCYCSVAISSCLITHRGPSWMETINGFLIVSEAP